MNSTCSELLSAAVQLMELGRPGPAASCLQAVLQLDRSNLDAHNLIEMHRLPGNFSDTLGVNARISPADEIFAFFAGHPTSINPIRDYLADGWRTLAELLLLFERLDRKLSRPGRFLEFASGFGRLTRHLVKIVPSGNLHVSDVLPGSVDFLVEQFGVEGFYSASQPGSADWPGSYDVIFVLSLFSHLPRTTWDAWLREIYSHVAPGGVLIFSTHGETSARTLGVTLPQDGFAFHPSSESKELPGEQYGSTFTSAAFVRAAIASNLDCAAVIGVPAHFWGNQDAFAVVRR